MPALAAPAGALDPTFGIDGKHTIGFDIGGYNNDEVTAMALAPGGRIYLAGILRRTISNNYAIGVSRLRHDGALDSAFGTEGRLVMDVVDGENVVLAAAIH